MTAKRWLTSLIALSLALLLLLAAICFLFDPFLQYRAVDHKRYLTSRFCCPGIMKTADYDAAVVGSSFTQNFDMQRFRDTLGVSPIKATIGGMSPIEQTDAIALMDRVGKAQTYYICLTHESFFTEFQHGENTYPDYLMDDNLLNDYRYLLGFEAWFRFLPADVGLLLCDALGIRLGEKIRRQRSIDALDDWSLDRSVGADAAWSAMQAADRSPLDAAKAERLYQAYIQNMESFLQSISFDENKQYVFFYPPMSALYWYQKGDSVLDAAQKSKAWFCKRLDDMPNVTIFDFDSMPETADLSLYCDCTHFCADVSDLLTDCFASGAYRVNADTVLDSNAQMRALLTAFYAENAERLGRYDLP